MKSLKFAPRKVFEQILEYSVIPTFDLIIEYGDKGVIVVKRKIPPYNNQWALPGLRMMKSESIDDTIKRIAKQELGLNLNAKNKILLGQYVGRFKTENQRQDISTCYILHISENTPIILNTEHFSSYKITKSIPVGTGAMYRFYLKQYLRK